MHSCQPHSQDVLFWEIAVSARPCHWTCPRSPYLDNCRAADDLDGTGVRTLGVSRYGSLAQIHRAFDTRVRSALRPARTAFTKPSGVPTVCHRPLVSRQAAISEPSRRSRRMASVSQISPPRPVAVVASVSTRSSVTTYLPRDANLDVVSPSFGFSIRRLTK